MKISGKCPTCNKPMRMYYTLHCFHCNKPKADKRGRANLFMAMYWMEANVPEFVKDDFWNYLLEQDRIEGNDTWVGLDGILEDCDNESVKLFHKHFPLDKDILWEVSW